MRLLSVLFIFLFIIGTSYAFKQQIEINGELIDVTGVPLYDYVNADDTFFQWEELPLTKHDEENEVTYHYLNFTSQKWLNEGEVDRSVWFHYLTIIRPWYVTKPDFSALYITGGGNGDDPTKAGPDGIVALILAKQLNCTVGVLYQVPNQRTVFHNDPLQKSRSEDALVGYTWRKYIDNPTRPDWVAYFPMVKAASRALDVIEEFSLQQISKGQWNTPITKFYLAGASKRGATTWLTSAYEGHQSISPRVIGSAPLVFDTLNFTVSVPRMWELLGGWTFAFEDYYDNGITNYVNTDAMHLLAGVVDPIDRSYALGLSRVPKLMVTAPGDEFFVIDNDKFFWDYLPGKNYRAIIPNTEHALVTNIDEVVKTIRGHVTALYYKDPMPTLRWFTAQPSGQLTLITPNKPDIVKLYYANTIPTIPNRRDFRLIKKNIPGGCEAPAMAINDSFCINPVLWTGIEVQGQFDNESRQWRYSYTPDPKNMEMGNTFEEIMQNLNNPSSWHGYYFVVEYNIGLSTHQWYSTQASIYPDTLPFEPCGTGTECYGELV